MIGFLILMALLGFPFLGIALYLSFSFIYIIIGLVVISIIASLLSKIFIKKP